MSIKDDMEDVQEAVINELITDNGLNPLSITDGTVTLAKLGSDVDLGQVNDGAVTPAKLSQAYLPLTGGSVTGNVGIGTTNPNHSKLHVETSSGGNALKVGTSTQGVFIKVTDTLVDYNASGNASGIHTFSSGNYEMIRFLGSGLVNIGESVESGSAGVAAKKLNVVGGLSTVYDASNASTWTGIQTGNSTNSSNRTATGLTFFHRTSSSGIAAIQSTSAAADRADLRFITRGSAGISQKMMISDEGHVILSNVPTSSSGLTTGTIYSDGGTLKIV